MIANAIAHAARAGVQREPDFVVLVEADLGKMIAAAERAERGFPVLIEIAVVRAGGGFELFELGDARLGRFCDFGVISAGGHGDAPLDAFAQAVQIFQVAALERSLECDHAAADVHAYSRRHDGALGGDHRADGGAFAVMAIGHHRDPLEDKGQLRGVQDLLLCLGLDLRPGQKRGDFFADATHFVSSPARLSPQF